MGIYRLALFIHILAAVVAGGVTALTKLAAGRRMRARTVGDALDWHNVLLSSARIFPLCLVVFLVTGGYMMSVVRVSPLTTGFIFAGLVGVVLLFASGAYLGIKGAALKKVLEGMAAKGADQPVPNLAPPPLVVILPTVNTGIALAVAFDMVMRMESVSMSLGVIAIGAVLGLLAAPRRPAVPMAAPAMMSEG